jgi:diaminohydroxyphosphoribosylaminopyrimidine deaminase/5-amino-6-(5-phosphoribosylamino)uracil reductase
MDKTHKQFMRLALDEASKGVGRTSPNPPVGAVIVKGDKVIATGYHHKAGGPHAEIVALRKAKLSSKGATLYITLEPCAHTGKTPPCIEAIIKSKIKEVVIGIRDPNPLVNGRGIRRLRSEGIGVKLGVLKSECERFYSPYRIFVTKKRPFVTLKAAP